MIKKICLYCKREFQTENNRKKYCSKNCCSYYNKKDIVKKCKNCKIEFKTRSTNKVQCSDECKSDYKRNELFTEDCNIYKNGFDKINSYIFGLIMSDGSLIFDKHSSRERIVFSSNDYDMLDKIRKYCYIARDIYKNKDKGYVLIYINQDAINFLKNYGLEYNKSKTNILPILPKDLMCHFIRGYFDGDGSILTNKNKYGTYQQVKFTTGSETFSKELNQYFRDLGYSSNIYNTDRNNFYVIISKTKQIADYYNYIYHDCDDWYFERKRVKFIYK